MELVTFLKIWLTSLDFERKQYEAVSVFARHQNSAFLLCCVFMLGTCMIAKQIRLYNHKVPKEPKLAGFCVFSVLSLLYIFLPFDYT